VRPRYQALTSALADLARSTYYYGHDVPGSTDGDKCWKPFCGFAAEDGFEEEGRGEFFGGANLCCGDGSEVGDVGEDVEY
jgi:hypothetical protein